MGNIKYMVGEVHGHSNNKLNKTVYEELRRVLEHSIVTMSADDLYDNINEFVRVCNDDYPRCKQLTTSMTSAGIGQWRNRSISIKDSSCDTVCWFALLEVHHEIDDIESYLF